MKKWLGALAAGIFLLIFLLLGSGGGGGGGSDIIMPFAEEEEAYGYQYIGSELGTPWDIVMLADGIHAYAAGERDLKNYNPMLTSLQFCIVMEEEFAAAEDEEEEPEEADGSDAAEGEEEPEETETEESEEAEEEPEEDEEKEPEVKWVSKDIRYYTGLDEILAYLDTGKDTEDITYRDATAIVAALTKVAEEKSTEDIRYETTLLVNTDYTEVLLDYIGLTEKDAAYVLELYDSNYLAALYGDSLGLSDIELPQIIQGSVTRGDLAQVAISLINHPYLMGGKSTQIGPPAGPLDCSGYVDWVYMQCFGAPVASGRLPEGVAVSGTAMQWFACEAITASELKVGDLGFLRDPRTIKNGQVNHVGIYLGTKDGKAYWIHCGGSAYKTDFSPKGRVGISLASGPNDYNPVDGSTFAPAMKACRFKFFRRPQFEFIE